MSFAFHFTVGHHPTAVKLGIVSDEFTDYQECSNLTTFTLTDDNFCKLNKISCRFIAEIEKTHQIEQLIFYDNFEAAFKDGKRGKLHGIIFFNVNFSIATQEFIAATDERDLDEGVLENIRINVYTDSTNFFIKYHFNNVFHPVYDSFMKNLKNDCEIHDKVDFNPLKFLLPIHGEMTINVHDRLALRGFLTFFFFGAMLNTIMVFMEDRLSGCWNRTLLTGVNSSELFIAHCAVHLVVLIMQLICIITFAIWIKVLSLNTHQPTILIFILVGFCGLLLGIMVGCWLKSFVAAALTINYIALVNYILSGEYS